MFVPDGPVRLSPQAAGLSHMAEHAEEKVIVPTGALHFAPDGGGVRMGPQNVEGKSSQCGKVSGALSLRVRSPSSAKCTSSSQ